MIKPKEHYVLHFDAGSPYKGYSTCIAEDNGDNTGTVVGWCGTYTPELYSEDEKSKLGQIIHFDVCSYKNPIVTNSHIKYVENIVKLVDTSYLRETNDLYYIWGIIGLRKFLLYMEDKKDGVLQDEDIEKLFSESPLVFKTLRNKGNLMLTIDSPVAGTWIENEKMSALIALKRYGVYKLEDSIERTYIIL